jgi:hypothetical protein
MLPLETIKASHCVIPHYVASRVPRLALRVRRCQAPQSYRRLVRAGEQRTSISRGNVRKGAELMLRRSEIELRSPLQEESPKLRVFQWNTLADGLAQNGDFVKVGLAPQPNWCPMTKTVTNSSLPMSELSQRTGT